MHADMGRELGLKIEEGNAVSSTGITGVAFRSYLHKIKYRVGVWDCEEEIAFSDQLGTPFGLLGRKGFFNLFKVHFNHNERIFEIEPYE